MATDIKFRSDIKVELIQHMGSDEMIARAARVSTGQDLIDGLKIKGLIRYLYNNRHTSPFEHTAVTFRVEAPMFVRDQWVRHRTQSYNIKSLRFSEASPEFYLVSAQRPLLNEGSGAHPRLVHSYDDDHHRVVNRNLQDSYWDAWQSYKFLVEEEGVAEELARVVLPTALYSPFYATTDLWNWLGFLDKRIESEHNKPQWEIEQAALQIQELLTGLFPVTMEMYRQEKEKNDA